MLSREQVERIKFKPRPTLNDVAILIISIEQLFKINDEQANYLKQCLKVLDEKNRRLEWYRQTTMKEVTQED